MRIQQREVRGWMGTAGQTHRSKPTADITDAERLLRARLVYEEAMEFVEAMGCFVNGGGEVRINTDDDIDLVGAVDAISDILVVTIGSACTLGVAVEPVFGEVMDSNWAKFPNGIVKRDEFGKVVKPDDWQPPRIEAVLRDQGWEG